MSKSHSDTRAPRAEILEHLHHLLGHEAVQVSKEVARYAIDGDRDDTGA